MSCRSPMALDCPASAMLFPKSRWRNTLNLSKYCSQMYSRVNCCCCSCVTTCCVETRGVTAWCQILWHFYAWREFCDVLRWRHVFFNVSCRELFKMCVGEERWWEYTHTKKIFPDFSSQLFWQVLRVHSHQEISRFIPTLKHDKNCFECWHVTMIFIYMMVSMVHG